MGLFDKYNDSKIFENPCPPGCETCCPLDIQLAYNPETNILTLTYIYDNATVVRTVDLSDLQDLILNIIGENPIVVNQVGENVTISLDPAFVASALATYTASNGLSMLLNNITLGGNLDQNTIINGLDLYNFTVRDIVKIFLNAGTLVLEGESAVEILALNGIFIKTPNINLASAQNGDVLMLLDNVTGESDFVNIDPVKHYDTVISTVPDDGAGPRVVKTYSLPANELIDNGDCIEIECFLSVTGTSGTLPTFTIDIGGLIVASFQHTGPEHEYLQTIKGKVYKNGTGKIYRVFESQIFTTAGVFITSYISRSGIGLVDWTIVNAVDVSFDLGVGDHSSSIESYIVTKFKK